MTFQVHLQPLFSLKILKNEKIIQMKARKKLLKEIKKSLSKMSDEKYYQIKEYKYIWFAKDGEYGGCSHYKFNLTATPLEKAEPLTYLAPMASKQVMLAALQEMIDQLGQASDLDNKKGFLSAGKIEDHLFILYADNYNRLFKFFEIENLIQPELYGQTLRRVYHNSVKKYHYRSELRRAFQKVPQQDVMTKEEEDNLNNLDERVTIYRAMSAKENELEDYGVSWTLYKDIAFELGQYCFNSIWKQAGFFVKELEVPKADLYALFNERNMHEVVYVQQEIPGQELIVTLLDKSQLK